MIKRVISAVFIALFFIPFAVHAQTQSGPHILGSRSATTGAHTAQLQWDTDMPSYTWIVYGESIAFGKEYKTATTSKNHEVILRDLKPSTRYYYQLIASDSESNANRSGGAGGGRFMTKDASANEVSEQKNTNTVPVTFRFEGTRGGYLSPITTTSFDKDFPQISNVSVIPSATTATVSWETASDAYASLDYGVTPEYGFWVGGDSQNGPFEKKHSVTLNGLAPSLTVHFQIHAQNWSGNKTATKEFTFVTPSQEAGQPVFYPDASSPRLVSIKVTPASTSFDIALQTDEPANVKVTARRLPTSSAEADTDFSKSELTVFEPAYETARTVRVGGLDKNAFYRYTLSLKDATGNESLFEYHVVTRQQEIPALQNTVKPSLVKKVQEVPKKVILVKPIIKTPQKTVKVKPTPKKVNQPAPKKVQPVQKKKVPNAKTNTKAKPKK